MATKRKKKSKTKAALTPEQKRNSDIFRLRGFFSNAKTLPFDRPALKLILHEVDRALMELGAESHSSYMERKSL